MFYGFLRALWTENRFEWSASQVHRLWTIRSATFFLISGYLAALTFVNKKGVDVKKYYVKRAIAILPLYFLTILYYFISENILHRVGIYIPPDELGLGWLRYIFLLNGFLNSDTYFWSNLGITWTIPIFSFFYLIAPWILKKIRGIGSSLIAWGSVAIICKAVNCFYSSTIITNLHYLFLGVVIYCCVHKKKTSESIAIFSAIAVAMVLLKQMTFVYVCIFSIVILALVSQPMQLPQKIQNAIDVLDRYSYTLYLMHGVVFCSVLDRLNQWDVSKIYIAFIAFAGTAFATWFVGKFMEKPLQSYLTKKFLKKG